MKLARMPDGSPEIFHTLQGEGRNVGRPSVFIRASLCNLHCTWCDTDYTWNWEDTAFAHESGRKWRRKEQIVDLDTEEIVTHVKSWHCHDYVFTGGEPLIQETAWSALMETCSERWDDCHFEIETNGTLFPKEDFLARIHGLNVSPKLSNSGVEESMRTKPEVLANLAATGKADFKFVIGDEPDLGEVLSLIEASAIPGDRVFLMPKARTVEELEANQSPVAEMAQAHGFRYSDRLHLRLYGAKRGV